MIVSERDGLYSAQHVTGPTHNILQLKLGRGPARDFGVVVLPPVGTHRDHAGLTSEDVVVPIRDGVARANSELGTDFAVLEARIVEDDSPQPAVYEYIARKIIEEAARTIPV